MGVVDTDRLSAPARGSGSLRKLAAAFAVAFAEQAASISAETPGPRRADTAGARGAQPREGGPRNTPLHRIPARARKYRLPHSYRRTPSPREKKFYSSARPFR